MATHSSTLAWRIPQTEEPSGLWFMGCTELDMTEATTAAAAELNVYPEVWWKIQLQM